MAMSEELLTDLYEFSMANGYYATLPHDQEVAKRHDRMIEEHPGAGIAHHDAYATAHFGIVAMH